MAKMKRSTADQMLYDTLLQKAYNCYQLSWLIEHNISLGRLISEIGNEFYYNSTHDTVTEAYERVIEGGINGEMFVCKDEFEDDEFSDADEVKEYLSIEDYLEWRRLVGKNR